MQDLGKRLQGFGLDDEAQDRIVSKDNYSTQDNFFDNYFESRLD